MDIDLTKDKLKKLKGYYNSLLGQKQLLDGIAESSKYVIKDNQYRVLVVELANIEVDFPELLPRFRGEEFHNKNSDDICYDVGALRAYLAVALGRLKVGVNTSEGTPVTEIRDFSFISDLEVRKIVERDYLEIQRAFVAQCWKSVIILSGGTIEAILVDLLLIHKSKAIAAVQAPNNNKSDITKWDLVSLIEVSVELGLVSSGAEKLSHSVREYRNLIHPGNEVRNKLTFGTEEAKIALEVLHIVHRDLSQ